MSFQFGTNWPGFMERAGNIAGPLLGYEVLTAFFLEASFLGIMLFGKQRVSNRTHLISTFSGRLRHLTLGLLDFGAQLVDAHTRGLRPFETDSSLPRAGLALSLTRPSLIALPT